ncbi:hypothetical protein [Campylobacter vulpis]|uniref:hypothetical protein n=1 Tax=Campylobacter vulpis TaxID=1655500 RepID=UPI001BCFBCE9|nr:hypothetical protein [Campylobacter vulpis]
MKKESEFEIVRAFSHILGLPNKTEVHYLFIKAKKASQKNLMAIIFMMALLLY